MKVGTEFAGYRIEGILGQGGMGEVYVARHPRLPRSDALKVLNAQYTADPQFRARFAREADLAATLSHPAIVKVYDRGEEAGRLWIAMELVDGQDLSALLRESGHLAANQAEFVVSTVADALDRANATGLVHRDVKPANILLSNAGDVLLTDFGIARVGGETSDLTGTGTTVGTLNYASPEQLSGEDLDGRSDQYSLACTAFQLLTGVAPFADSNAAVVISGHLNRPLPSVLDRRPDLSSAVDQVLARATAKDRTTRYPTSSAFAEALSQAFKQSDSDATVLRPAAWPPVMGDPSATQIRPSASDGQPGTARAHAGRGTVIAIAAAAIVIVLGAGGATAFFLTRPETDGAANKSQQDDPCSRVQDDTKQAAVAIGTRDYRDRPDFRRRVSAVSTPEFVSRVDTDDLASTFTEWKMNITTTTTSAVKESCSAADGAAVLVSQSTQSIGLAGTNSQTKLIRYTLRLSGDRWMVSEMVDASASNPPLTPSEAPR
ncbi:serine/threonine-protein kinase [Tsukamurella sp. DT100]|uniref:serine/threonine-protein kinase n=1 Tax=Tsukamurella sp. DT100 TaxID=3393415 RepID=UPI003CF96864